MAYFFLGRPDRAAAEAREVVKIYPKNYVQRYNLSQYLMFSGNFGEAITEGSRVTEEAPTYSVAYLPVALSKLATGDVAGAQGVYDRLEQVEGLGPELARIGRADFAMYRGRYRDALKLIAKGGVVTGASAKPQAQDFVAAAEAQFAIGQKSQAAETAMKAVRQSTNESVVFPAALVLVDAGNSAEARKLADTLENMLQVQTTAYAQLIVGEIAVHEGRYGAALERFQEGLKRRDSWFGHYLRGKLYVETKHFPEALSDLDTAVKRKGEATDIFASDTATIRYLPPAYYWLARAQEAVGDAAGARKSYEQYIAIRAESDPPDPLVTDSKKRLAALH
jgi:tetratricopeptide (TPR) repeat protein